MYNIITNSPGVGVVGEQYFYQPGARPAGMAFSRLCRVCVDSVC